MASKDPITFDQWRAQAQSLNQRADKVRSMIVARARKTALDAGLDPAIFSLHAHNAMCGFHNGRPWPEVNYSLVRRVQWLESKSWEPSRIAERIIDRKWRQHIAANGGRA